MFLESIQSEIHKITFLLTIGFVLLSGCNNDDHTSVKEDNIDNEYAASSDDVIDEHGKITNLDEFEDFVKNVEEGEQDQIRIVRYTSEGDPVIQDFEYDTERITVTNDMTRDRYGDGEISTISCKSIGKENTENGIVYQLNNCENPNGEIDVLVVEE